MGKCVTILLIVFLWVSRAWAELDVSPSFLGMYRKTMEIDDALLTHSARYGIDQRLARAVAIQESGGNAHLVSPAGARGYFQVMPKTFRMLRVRTNIEAGIKYLAHLRGRFGREDYAIAAYNAGPSAIAKDRPLRLETLQYVINVGHYRWILRLYEPEIRRQAQTLRLRQVRRGESWETLARATGIPASVLRWYNPFLAVRPLQAGALIAYPPSMPVNLLEYEGDEIYYISRLGDSCLQLGLIFGVPLETFREHNDLWHLQQLPVGVRLRIAVPTHSPFRKLQMVSEEQSAQTQELFVDRPVQVRLKEQPSQAQGALSDQPTEVTSTQEERDSQLRVYHVQQGDTLSTIARRHQTTVQALMQVNGLRDARLQIGTVLQIPATRLQHNTTRQETQAEREYSFTKSVGEVPYSGFHLGASLLLPVRSERSRASGGVEE